MNQGTFIALFLLTTASFNAAAFTVPKDLLSEEQVLEQVLEAQNLVDGCVDHLNTLESPNELTVDRFENGASCPWEKIKIHLAETYHTEEAIPSGLDVVQAHATLEAANESIANLIDASSSQKKLVDGWTHDAIAFLQDKSVENVYKLNPLQQLNYIFTQMSSSTKQEPVASTPSTATIVLAVLFGLALVGIAILAFLLFRKSD